MVEVVAVWLIGHGYIPTSDVNVAMTGYIALGQEAGLVRIVD